MLITVPSQNIHSKMRNAHYVLSKWSKDITCIVNRPKTKRISRKIVQYGNVQSKKVRCPKCAKQKHKPNRTRSIRHDSSNYVIYILLPSLGTN